MCAGGRHWANCPGTAGDTDIAAIDAVEESIAPLDRDTAHIRRLITSLESCHHKAGRWVELIIGAVGAGKTDKGPGTRPPGKKEPIEELWRHAWVSLSAWCAGCPPDALGLDVGGTPAGRLLGIVGDRTPLKEWQCQRIVDKMREYVTWPGIFEDPALGYAGMTEYAEGYRGHSEYTDYYGQHGVELERTLKTQIHDTVDGEPAEISLAGAIDNLQPCNWNFLRNFEIVLGAIGGNLRPSTPFAAHDRNIKLTPIRDRMKTVCGSLSAFSAGAESANSPIDERVLAVLGEETPVKQWLAASLEKTLRLQLGM